MNSNHEKVEELRWKKFPILDDGFVCLVDVMGDDAAVTQAARVSYGKDLRDGETAAKADDRTLIRYMMRHNHGTPMEMVEAKFLIRIPMDAWRQFVRHRTLNINEYSTRYTQAIDSCQTTPTDQWRAQSTTNKQGSSGFLTEWPKEWLTSNPDEIHAPEHPINTRDSNCKTLGDYLTYQEECLQTHAQAVYEERLAAGVAKEQARKDLPLSTYTEAYVKCDLRNWLHFLGLRMDSHAQLEIRSYANAIGKIIEELFPITWEAFHDYRLKAMTLSALDQQAVTSLMIARNGFGRELSDATQNEILDRYFNNKREREECVVKLKVLGIIG